MPAKNLARRDGQLIGGIQNAFDVTPSDTDELPYVTRQIKCTGAGNLVVVWAGGNQTTEAVEAGVFYDWRVKQIRATNTTATGIRAYI